MLYFSQNPYQRSLLHIQEKIIPRKCRFYISQSRHGIVALYGYGLKDYFLRFLCSPRLQRWYGSAIFESSDDSRCNARPVLAESASRYEFLRGPGGSFGLGYEELGSWCGQWLDWMDQSMQQVSGFEEGPATNWNMIPRVWTISLAGFGHCVCAASQPWQCAHPKRERFGVAGVIAVQPLSQRFAWRRDGARAMTKLNVAYCSFAPNGPIWKVNMCAISVNPDKVLIKTVLCLNRKKENHHAAF